jgi:CRISPR system Cascade subunit CasD
MVDLVPIRFDAPLFSFGAPAVDRFRKTARFPALSMVTGLIGNALGVDHREAVYLNELQQSLTIGSRVERSGQTIRDYQTVDLSQPFMREGWTTRGAPESRGGGTSTSTHIRHRHYWCDSIVTTLVRVESAPDGVSPGTVLEALQHPERPLFIGRKSCLPAGPLAARDTLFSASSIRSGLASFPAHDRSDGSDQMFARWPASPDHLDEENVREITDTRDWRNQIHAGHRFVRQDTISLEDHSS